MCQRIPHFILPIFIALTDVPHIWYDGECVCRGGGIDGPQMLCYRKRPQHRPPCFACEQQNETDLGSQRAKSAHSGRRQTETRLRQHPRTEVRQSPARLTHNLIHQTKSTPPVLFCMFAGDCAFCSANPALVFIEGVQNRFYKASQKFRQFDRVKLHLCPSRVDNWKPAAHRNLRIFFFGAYTPLARSPRRRICTRIRNRAVLHPQFIRFCSRSAGSSSRNRGCFRIRTAACAAVYSTASARSLHPHRHPHRRIPNRSAAFAVTTAVACASTVYSYSGQMVIFQYMREGAASFRAVPVKERTAAASRWHRRVSCTRRHRQNTAPPPFR